jgi:alkylhydroperoxidase family enzyme
MADRLHHGPLEVDDQFYAKLKSVYNEQQIIELTAVSAAFEFFTRFVDALRIPTTPVPEHLQLSKKG